MLTKKPLFMIVWIFLSFHLQTEPVSSQTPPPEKNITLNCENTALRSVLKKISIQCKIGFVFQDDLVDGQTVTCRAESLPLEQALKSILNSINISFTRVQDGTIVLYNEAKTGRLIKGWVVDASNGNGLPFANILQEGTTRGTVSDPDGYFTLMSNDPNPCTIRVSYIGYRPEQVSINAIRDSDSLKIAMREKPVEGKAVVVTGEKIPAMRMSENPGQIVFSPREIDYVPTTGDRNALRTVQFLPGISAGYNDRPSEFSIYGGAENENLVLLDGIPIYKPDIYFGFLSAFHPRAIEKVNVLKGGYPAKYGDRLSGIIELTGNTVPENKFNFGVGADLFSTNAFIELPINRKLHWFFSGCLSHPSIVSGYPYRQINEFLTLEYQRKLHSGSDITEECGQYSFYDIISKVSYSISRKNQCFATFFKKQEKQKELPADDNFVRCWTYNWKTTGFSIQWNSIWSHRFNSDISMVYSNHSNLNEELYVDNYPTLNFYYSNTTSRNSTVLDKILKMNNNIHLKNMAIEFGYQLYINNYIYYNNNTTIKGFTYETYHNNYTKDIKNMNDILYMQNKWTVFSRLDISAGLRAIRFIKPFNKTYWDPRLSAQLSISKRFKINGSWGIFRQFGYSLPNRVLKNSVYTYFCSLKTSFEGDYLSGFRFSCCFGG